MKTSRASAIAPVGVERDRSADADERKVAVAASQLDKGATVAGRKAGQPHLDEQLVGRERGGQVTGEEVARGDRALTRAAARRPARRRAPARLRAARPPGRRARCSRRLCRGCGSSGGRRSASARSHQRRPLVDQRGALGGALARHRTDRDAAVPLADAGELAHTADVDQRPRARPCGDSAAASGSARRRGRPSRRRARHASRAPPRVRAARDSRKAGGFTAHAPATPYRMLPCARPSRSPLNAASP